MVVAAMATLTLLLGSCSVQKNTPLSRSYHATKVRYNILYNGTNSYDQGIEAINQAHLDDYTQILPLYPVSDHKAAEASRSQMDVTIEKCRKSIKLHSIKKKPEKINEARRSDPAYKAWLKQEEFNPAMPLAWLMLGKAEFHKGEFLESVGTFNYIQKHFDYDKDVVAQCQLWTVRAYAEEGWLYEAEDLLSKVKVDDLKRKNASLFAAVTADLKLKQGLYKEAIPFVKLAMEDESRKGYRPRFAYVLAQLYEKDSQPARARANYKKVVKMYPDWEMDFNARLRISQLDPNHAASVKMLTKMAARPKYKDRLDLIYGAIGNIHLMDGDTTAALLSYEQGIEGSTQNGFDKAQILITAGDLYFDRTDYVHAQPCYSEAATILSNTHEAYPRVKKRAEVLDELVVEVNTVTLQDSLQRLSLMSEEEQMRVAEALVAALIEQERNDSIAAVQAARNQANGHGLQSVNTSNMLGGGGGAGAAWYFYNPNLMRSGKQQFQKKWGARVLEDNWRRSIKTSVAFPSMEDNTNLADGEETDSLFTDSLAVPTVAELVSDQHDPRYYLQQIPRTEEDIARSNEMIADALYNMVYIYRDRLADLPQADRTKDELQRRFPNDPRLPQLEPDPRLQDPAYIAQVRRMMREQDSLYEATYEAFKQGNFADVKAAKLHIEELYPEAPLMPRFLFLNAIAIARTDGQEPFAAALQDMLERYPSSEVGAMAKDMLAMMNLGEESQVGGQLSSLDEQRTLLAQEEVEEAMEEAQEERNIVLIRCDKDEKTLHQLLYEVALFNFSQFMIKDFDLRAILNYSDTESAVEISGFESADEVEWYKNMLRQAETNFRF